ncbi:hypothetical protein [Rhodopirellula sp. SWK7]|uniref:hypothetical protein n=1 Tax=Rhodopirellula sp. SWK7 TaxID=595460 RepID=UPI0002BEFE56|nr:hypothetical protein [Rhodopirellula sp. SWK7]EMI46178.1 membrane protein [Rhodopirellula sp. SWK7]
MKRELLQLAIDVGISLLLFIFACAAAGAASNRLPPNGAWLYSLWFAVGMLPFCVYARHRGILDFDFWDVVAYSPFPIVIGLTQMWIGHPAALLLACLAMFTLGRTIRRQLPTMHRRTT